MGVFFSVDTPILVVGCDLCAVLRIYFEGIGFGAESVTYAESIGEGRVRAKEHCPSVLLIDVVCGGHAYPVAQSMVDELRKASPALYVIAVGDAGCVDADEWMAFPPSQLEFDEALGRATLGYASRAACLRGDVGAHHGNGGAR